METNELHEAIGELLAAGYTDEDIVSTLQDHEGFTRMEACEALRGVYSGWQSTREELGLNENNLVDWHVFLRKQLLQRALAEGSIAALKLALGILDSLAAVQGISATQGQSTPLAITLVEKKEDTSEQD